MALQITSLNSGSNGNCYYIGNGTEAVLVDMGISCKETEKRMQALGLDIKKVKAIFISHEHTDHIKGLATIASKYALPVFITQPTYLKSGLQLQTTALQWIKAHEAVPVGNLTVTAFPKKHDAHDPHSFVITGDGVTVGVFTDIGAACINVTQYFGQCHAAFLEANYDEDLLENGRYPYFLKNRIRGGLGHLSNKQALEIFTTHRPSFMSHLFLSHLSKDNNDPQLVQDLFENHSLSTKIIVAPRHKATDIYTIQHNTKAVLSNVIIKNRKKPLQMALFN